MRSIRKRKATSFGLAVALCALCALPGAAAVAPSDADAPSWGARLVERVVDSVAGWFAFDGKGNDAAGDDGDTGFGFEGFDGPTSNNFECPPAQPDCNDAEGGPDWDPNG